MPTRPRRIFPFHLTILFVAQFSGAISLRAQQPNHSPVETSHVKSGRAFIHQQGLTSTLVLNTPSGKPRKVVITHKSLYPRLMTLPNGASFVAEIPHRLLIFTDNFASNPDNVQGMCGQSETGETYLHVVSLGPAPRETLSALIDSCLTGVHNVEQPVFDSSSRKLQFDLTGGVDLPYTFIYRIAPDNSVTLIEPAGWHGFPP
jgi:hypothetical protein